MHSRPVFKRLHRLSLGRLILGLLLTATCIVCSSDSQFDVVAKKKLFIDRTFLAEQLFEDFRIHRRIGAIVDHHFIIGPKKSGKSTNLSMMKQFLAATPLIEVGKRQLPNTTKHYDMFSRLKIGQRPFFKEYFASLPVIYVNLAEIVVDGSETDFKKSFCDVIRGLIDEHEYLLESKGVSKSDKRELENYKNPEKCLQMNTFDQSYFGKTLARLMHKHTRARVLVLIDEVDFPGLSILRSNATYVNRHFILETFQFVTNMIGNNQWDVMGSFMTGATKQGVFLGDTQVFFDYGLQYKLKNFYGVTETEVRNLASISGVQMTDTLMEELRNMYGGYGLTEAGNNDTVFNTQSIIKFCEHKVVKPYWTIAPEITAFRKLLTSEGPLMEDAMHSERHLKSIDPISENGFFELKDFLVGKTNNSVGLFKQFIEGYLWEIGIFSSPTRFGIKVANDENRLILLDLVLNKDYFMAKHGVGEKRVGDFVDSVAKLDSSEISVNNFADTISRLFKKGLSDIKNGAILRYPLYSYLNQANELFSKVSVELGPKIRSDIIVELKDGTKVFLGLTLDQASSQDALKRVLADQQVQEFSKQAKNKFICLGVNLHALESRFDVSYLFGSANFADAKHLMRSCRSRR